MPKPLPPARPPGFCDSPPVSRPDPPPPAPRLFRLLQKIDAASSSSIPPPGRTRPREEAFEADLSKWTLTDLTTDPSSPLAVFVNVFVTEFVTPFGVDENLPCRANRSQRFRQFVNPQGLIHCSSPRGRVAGGHAGGCARARSIYAHMHPNSHLFMGVTAVLCWAVGNPSRQPESQSRLDRLCSPEPKAPIFRSSDEADARRPINAPRKDLEGARKAA